MQFSNKKIGIWGLGTTGKSALAYFHAQGAVLYVMDKKALSVHEQELLVQYHATYLPQDAHTQFFSAVDYVLPSPGIDLRPYGQYAHKWLSELDIIQANTSVPIIAITGTIGKTTVTALLDHVLTQAGKAVFTGGNIGRGMLDLLTEQKQYDYAVLELSSFQLELSKQFTPFMSIITSFYPNHLDRHESAQAYWQAKYGMCTRQKETDVCILPLELASRTTSNANQVLVGLERPAQVRPEQTMLYMHNDALIKEQRGIVQKLTTHLALCTYLPNVLLVYAASSCLGVDTDTITHALETFKAQEHRLEKVATKNGIDFYNDSKATIPQATIAAVELLAKKPIILLLGGTSKGVDRSTMFTHLHGKVAHIVCFGAEAEHLAHHARAMHIRTDICTTLEHAMEQALLHARPGSQIILSPAGASFDLFTNYQERGKRFKELVLAIR